eukprot:gnl/TRDRNA2_/TRDRNA2_158339_c0_seq7.p1 gnl/TRDRNA2_/TRDRNA2_158339_c0~~gnl/TRDRNA2_/TRDRNA2_158339_c0_seq7.p1  ORF type:complete len:413 (-),score=31.63 gnl/TRDRNA2_/TRDRNA2_158339_c0_seq7:58-1296(-)
MSRTMPSSAYGGTSGPMTSFGGRSYGMPTYASPSYTSASGYSAVPIATSASFSASSFRSPSYVGGGQTFRSYGGDRLAGPSAPAATYSTNYGAPSLLRGTSGQYVAPSTSFGATTYPSSQASMNAAGPPRTITRTVPASGGPSKSFSASKYGCDNSVYQELRLSVPNESIMGPVLGLLEWLKGANIIEHLPPEEDGVFHVTVPFCDCFMECPVIVNFLEQEFLTRADVKGIHILVSDLRDRLGVWRNEKAWVESKGPQWSMDMIAADLSKEQLPPASLAIGLHPEVNRGSHWITIIQSILNATKRGAAVFGSYFETEARRLAKIAQDSGLHVEIHKNPYWIGRAITTLPSAQYITIIRGKDCPGPIRPEQPEAVAAGNNGALYHEYKKQDDAGQKRDHLAAVATLRAAGRNI